MGASPAKAASSANQAKPEQKEEEKKVDNDDHSVTTLSKVEEKKVEVKRDSNGLGLSIVGGSDTPLVRI